MNSQDRWVSYEAFGATGDGVTDDMAAICRAHDHANAHGLAVRSKPEATYYIGGGRRTCVIATDTDWNTAHFTIDDTAVEDRLAPCFEVRSLLAPEALVIERLCRDQARLDVRPAHDCHVLVENTNRKKFIRLGLNQDEGTPQHDCFVLRQDGSVDSPIDWDYDVITRTEARPVDAATLYLRGGIFTTFANRLEAIVGYHYWARNIVIRRSNTVVDGLTHYVAGETAVGSPYLGFIIAQDCAFVTFRNCFATAHKIYQTSLADGKPVAMGSYDYAAFNVVGFTMINCRMNNIADRTRWGVIESSFCKNVLVEDCCLNRMDTHMGISGSYTIRRCTLGWQCLNAIGRGQLTVEDSTLYGEALIYLRSDYGSTWEGELTIRNCRWIPACGDTRWPHLIRLDNDGQHDFGYRCFMPREVTIDGLFVDDANAPADYQGMYFFTDPGYGSAARQFPYVPCRRVTCRRLTTASGLRPSLSPSAWIGAHTILAADA